MQASVEMSNSPEQVVKTLKSMPEYVERFKKAFSADKDPVTFDTMAKAIEAFEATLLTPDSRFDKFLTGDEKALTAREKDGLQLFMNKGCAVLPWRGQYGRHGLFPLRRYGKAQSGNHRRRYGPLQAHGRERLISMYSNLHRFAISNLRPPIFIQARSGA